MGRRFQEKKEEQFQREAAALKKSGKPCPQQYPHNVYARLYGLGYRCIDDQIEIDGHIYPVKFFHRQQKIGKFAKQHILSVFIFCFMPQDAKSIFETYMRGIDRMIAAYTEFSSGKIKAGMSLCMEQEVLCDYIAEYCVRENSVNAFLGNIPVVYEQSSGKLYVKEAQEKMPPHYAIHLEDLKKAFWETET